MHNKNTYIRGFIPYALAAALIGLVGGFSAVLGPAFVKDIGIAYNNTTWTALAQAASTAACAPVLGKLGDILGRRRTLLLGIGVFTLGNVLSAFATSLVFMMIARFTVGIGTAAIAPVVMAYIVTQFPEDKVAKGFSVYMLISSATVIFGPTLGGLIIAAYSWRTMIWVCTAISGITFVACLLTAKKEDNRGQKPEHFDGVGAALVIVVFSLVLCIPSFGQNLGWNSVAFWGVLIGAAVSLGVLIGVEKRAKQPILPGKFMARKAFALSVFILFLTQGLMQANMTNTIVFVNYTQPENTAVSGYAISVMYLGMSLGAVLLGPLADRFEPKHILFGSLLLTGAGCGAMLLYSAVTSPALLMTALGVLGLGLGGNATILMKVALSGVPSAEAGARTGTYGLFRDLAAPFGVAVFVPLFTNQTAGHLAQGTAAGEAAVQSIHTLAVTELLCVVGGLAAVFFLPKIHRKRG